MVLGRPEALLCPTASFAAVLTGVHGGRARGGVPGWVDAPASTRLERMGIDELEVIEETVPRLRDEHGLDVR